MPRWWGPKELFMSDGCFWFVHQYSNVSSDVFLRWTLVIWDTNRFLSKLCTVSDASFRILDVQIHVFFRFSKQLTVFPFLISGLLWKIGDAGGLDPRTSRIQSKRSSIWATSLVRKGAANDIWSLSFVNEMIEQFSIAYGSKIGFVDAVHQSMCFSHANRLPFRLTCLAAGGSTWAVYVRRMSLIVLSVEFMFPSTSFWGKPWRFGPLIAFSASSVLFQILPFAYWTYKSMSSFGLRKQLTVFPFLISGLLWKIGDAGHRSPYLSHAKRALYHLSYFPVEETGSYCLIEPSLCYWNSSTESSIAYRCNIGFVGAGHQSMCFSDANRLPSRLTCLAGGVQRSCLCQTDAFDSFISIVMFPPTSFWGEPWWFGTPIAFSASSVLFQMLPFAYWTYKSMSSFGFQNSLPFFLFWFPGSFEKLEMRGASIPVLLACKAGALPSELHP